MVDENETVAQSAVMGAENPNWPDEPKTAADVRERDRDRIAELRAGLSTFRQAEIEEPEDVDFLDEDDDEEEDDFFEEDLDEDDEAVFDEPEEDEDAV